MPAPGSKHCRWRSTRLMPGPAPSGSPMSTVCSAHCSISSRSTPVGRRPSRPRSVKHSRRSWSTARNRRSARWRHCASPTPAAPCWQPGSPPNHGRLPDVGEAVLPHVRSGRPGMTGLLDALVGAAVRVEGLDQAVEAALSHPDAVIVTPAGDRFAPTGWRVGAAAGGATAAALDDARQRAEQAEVTLAAAEAALRAARDAQEAARATGDLADAAARSERRPVHGGVRGRRPSVGPPPRVPGRAGRSRSQRDRTDRAPRT